MNHSIFLIEYHQKNTTVIDRDQYNSDTMCVFSSEDIFILLY